MGKSAKLNFKELISKVPWCWIIFAMKPLKVEKFYDLYPNTPGARGGPGGRDRTLAVKRRKNSRKSVFFRRGGPGGRLSSWSAYMQPYSEEICNLKKNYNFFLRKKVIFRAVFLLFTANVRSQPPGPPLVPEVFFLRFIKSIFLALIM